MLQRLMCNVPFRRTAGEGRESGRQMSVARNFIQCQSLCHYCWLASCSILPDRWLVNTLRTGDADLRF